MNDGEFVLGILGLFLGLTVTELLSKTADLIHVRNRTAFGWLSPLMAIVVVLGMMGTWVNVYEFRSNIHVSWHLVLVVISLASAWYFAASMVMPRKTDGNVDLSAHYWENKSWIVTVQFIVSFLSQAYFDLAVAHDLPSWTMFDTKSLIFIFIPLAIQRVSRSKAVDASMMTSSSFSTFSPPNPLRFWSGFDKLTLSTSVIERVVRSVIACR